MTDYKVGDEVLVRVKLIHQYANGDFRGELDDMNKVYVPQAYIYSLAPEFQYLEEIEVRDNQNDNWLKTKFIAQTPSGSTVGMDIYRGVHLWKHARKIQPEVKFGKGTPVVILEVGKPFTFNGKTFKLQEVSGE